MPHLPKTPQATHERDAGSHAVHASPNKITKNCPELFHWGLQERLLDIAENYLGLPPAYLGVNLRKDVPNRKQTGTRLWHKDGEDRRVLKVIIYLNDVGEDGGPFEYIPPHLSPSYRPFQHIYCKILDGDMQQVVPASNWKACTGSAGTVVIVDTAKVFHHGKIPQSERAALFFCYTSRQPKRLDICHTHYSRARAMEIAQTLPQRQKECVLWEK